MVCPFEFLHFIPLAAIVLVAFFGRNKFTRVGVSAIISGLSIIGLTAGGHMHTAHAEPILLLDPCVGYMVSLAISVMVILGEVAGIKKVSK